MGGPNPNFLLFGILNCVAEETAIYLTRLALPRYSGSISPATHKGLGNQEGFRAIVTWKQPGGTPSITLRQPDQQISSAQ